MNRASCFILLLLTWLACIANNTESNFQQEEKALYEQTEKVLVNFYKLYEDLWNNEVEEKDNIVKKCLDLFLAGGDKYYCLDAFGNKEEHSPVSIKIINPHTNATKIRSVKNFLSSLSHLRNRNMRIEISSIEIVRIDNVSEIGEGRYSAIAYFITQFRGYRDGKACFEDKTIGKVCISFNQPNELSGKTTSQILLGDMVGLETKY